VMPSNTPNSNVLCIHYLKAIVSTEHMLCNMQLCLSFLSYDTMRNKAYMIYLCRHPKLGFIFLAAERLKTSSR